MKKRSKVSAEFSMSSLTDIIFLLLIFFMLTSSMVQINIPLPESSSTTVAPSDLIVMLTKDGNLSFNGKKTTKSNLRSQIKSTLSGMSNKDNADLAIVAEAGVTWDKMYEMMVLANSLGIDAHIATQPPK